MEAPAERLFVRRATGLVREIGLPTAVIIGLCNVIGLGWQKRVFQVVGWTPVRESEYFLGIHPMTMAFLLGGILVLLTAWCYASLAAAMPRSGGGYVFISRIIHPAAGFIGGWLATWATAVSYGLIGVAVMESLIIFGGLAGIQVPESFSSPLGLFLFGLVVIVIFSGIAFFGVRIYGYFLWALFIVPAIILLLVYILFLTANPDTLNAGIQSLFGVQADRVTRAAIDQGMARIAAGNTYWGAVATALIGAVWAYGGYVASTFVAGEVKEGARNVPRAVLTTGIVVILLYVTISLLLGRASAMIGRVDDFSLGSAIGFMNYGGGDWKAAGLPKIGGWMPMVAAMQAAGLGMGNWVMFLLVLFSAMWVANDIPPFILTTSRTVFAMAFDRMLPEAFADVSERFHSPTWAIVGVSVVAVFGAAAESDLFSSAGIGPGQGSLIYALINPGGALTATDIWGGIFDTLVVLAALLFAYRKADIFERSPFRQSKTTLTVVGAAAVIANLWALWTFITHPKGWYIFGITDLVTAMPFIFSLVLILAAVAIYAYYANRNRVTGVDMRTIFATIPPE